MPNPGTPKSMQQQMPGMPKGTMIGMVLIMVIMLVVMSFREQVGGALNVVFQFINFGGRWPVLTLIIAGLIMITLSTVIRGFLTDPIAQARTQQIQSAFNAEMRQARLENNLFKLKKLKEKQPEMMVQSMKASTDMMKIMPVTMVIVIPIYAWVWYFLDFTVPVELLTINLPWGPQYIMDGLWVMPVWIIIYTLISLPIGQLENRFVRFILLRKRLRDLDDIEHKS